MYKVLLCKVGNMVVYMLVISQNRRAEIKFSKLKFRTKIGLCLFGYLICESCHHYHLLSYHGLLAIFSPALDIHNLVVASTHDKTGQIASNFMLPSGYFLIPIS